MQSGSAAVCRICPIRFWKIQESSTTDFLPDWVESVPVLWRSMNISLTRGDDPEAVKKNRELIAQAIGVEVADFTYTQQTHTTNVKRVYAGERGQSFPETDGMITDVPGICLVTSYADCVPLYFVDPVKKVIGLSHSGWRGTVGKIGKVTVEKMEEEFGCDPADILGAVGPSICQDCYEVSEDDTENSVRIMTKISGLKFLSERKWEISVEFMEGK